jgi:hypothetical protein
VAVDFNLLLLELLHSEPQEVLVTATLAVPVVLVVHLVLLVQQILVLEVVVPVVLAVLVL